MERAFGVTTANSVVTRGKQATTMGTILTFRAGLRRRYRGGGTRTYEQEGRGGHTVRHSHRTTTTESSSAATNLATRIKGK